MSEQHNKDKGDGIQHTDRCSNTRYSYKAIACATIAFFIVAGVINILLGLHQDQQTLFLKAMVAFSTRTALLLAVAGCLLYELFLSVRCSKPLNSWHRWAAITYSRRRRPSHSCSQKSLSVLRPFSYLSNIKWPLYEKKTKLPVFPVFKRNRYIEGGCRGPVVIYGFPSSGGAIIIDDPSIIDVDFLGLGKATFGISSMSMEPLEIMSAAEEEERRIEEDEFCDRMRMIGAKFWRNVELFDSSIFWRGMAAKQPDLCWGGVSGLTDEEREYMKMDRVFGWPKNGGVWVYIGSHTDQNPSERALRTPTMEERCRIMKEELKDARFYSDPKECPELWDVYHKTGLHHKAEDLVVTAKQFYR